MPVQFCLEILLAVPSKYTQNMILKNHLSDTAVVQATLISYLDFCLPTGPPASAIIIFL